MTKSRPRRRLSGWDLAAILALGAAGSALSYDALRQMAAAIHIRPQLTYLFPLLLDGFIAYGVRAVVLLRRAALHARAYAWSLFSAATAASVWANALHAVTLNNQAAQHDSTDGLRLSNLTVGILSTLAPLALGGAVHLYIVIARHHSAEDDSDLAVSHDTVKGDRAESRSAATQTPARHVDPALAFRAARRLTDKQARTHRPAQLADTQGNRTPVSPDSAPPEATPPQTGPATPSATPALTGDDNARASQGVLVEPADNAESATAGGDAVSPSTDRRADRTDAATSTTWRSSARAEVMRRPALTARTDPAADLDHLLPIARNAAAEAGRLNRAVVADGIRASGYRISNERVTEVMRALRNPSTNPPAKPPGRHRR
ncbi:DUF2637 domain-containing protein [Streptacidiphilus fuscans]|uniref:DUF2637 domain-containing protein n=1 Tax=Streptacidiphilus fuscans TaxID=2789292 RepID=A0A931B652_9ACTN|nr:DUF2637 domain-containing protein [Streptacidiphilus fuscans]MBF9071819.1 DUF2637 domain-containing protein [Streptacidiphilus fuscans]